MSITEKHCSVKDCQNKHLAKGYCVKHYLQVKRHGHILEHTVYDKRPCIFENGLCKLPVGMNAKDGYAIIDKEYQYLDKYYWSMSGTGYPQTNINLKPILLHKFIITDIGIVDHKNNNRLDNRTDNLRLCSASQNVGNMTMPCCNTLGYKGISYHKKNKKWCAKVGGKYLGSYLTKKEAAMAYDKGATAKWGEYAKTNFGD